MVERSRKVFTKPEHTTDASNTTAEKDSTEATSSEQIEEPIAELTPDEPNVDTASSEPIVESDAEDQLATELIKAVEESARDEEAGYCATPTSKEDSPYSDSVFIPIDIDDVDTSEVSAEYSWDMHVREYIGHTERLLNYAVSLERNYKVTLPLLASGLNRYTFDAIATPASEEDDKMIVTLNTSLEGDIETVHAYELIELGKSLYFSCITDSLDKEYLHSVIAEATAAIKLYGKYLYKLECLRVLKSDNCETGALIYTLRLNSFELNILCNYMSKFADMRIMHFTTDGEACILFSVAGDTPATIR